MQTQAPAIDRRTYRDLVSELEALVEKETPWRAWVAVPPTAADLTGTVLSEDLYQPGSDPPRLVASRGTEVDAALAQKIAALSGLEGVRVARAMDAAGSLIRIGGRLAALVIERLNKLPEKAFLAFLDLIGGRLAPPRPARVPLTFQLAAGSPVDALVPAGTQVAAAPAEGEDEPVVFETERDLVVTRSQLVAAFVRQPGPDRYRDVSALARGEKEGTFAVFSGEDRIAHRIYVGHSRLLAISGQKTVHLALDPPGGEPATWLWPTKWSCWDGVGWKPLAAVADGQVTLPQVPAVAPAAVDSKKSAWLRGELSRTGVPSDWTATALDTVRIGVEITGSDLMPELAFSNQQPIDPSTDFFPFGEKPKIGDVFYLASNAALARPGAAITLDVKLTEPPFVSQSPALELAWEYWNGKRWTVLEPPTSLGGEISDDTAGSTLRFVEDGTISFACPGDIAPVEVQGEQHHWLRVRLAQGNYGVEAGYREAGTVTTEDSQGNEITVPYYQLTQATLRPPSIRSLQIDFIYEEKDQPPDHVLTENDFAFAEATTAAGTPGLAFQPFSPSSDRRPSFYLGFDRPGADSGFGNRSVALFLAAAETLYESSRQEVAGDEVVVVWEYWNGRRYKLLDVGDETRGLTRQGLVTFLGPSDFRRRREFGRRAFWLRARWDSGVYAAPPKLAWISTSTIWASHHRTLDGEVLGGSSGERDQLFTTAQTPVLGGQKLEVREPERPSAEELEALEAEVGPGAVDTVLDAKGRPAEIWVRWHQVTDFYASGPRSRHYALDRLTGEVRFGDGRRGLAPPAGRNNVRMARYRTGGGTSGNLAAGSLVQLKGAVPYVDGVVNRGPAAGGAGRESLAEVRRRAPRSLRHRGRAVAGGDFEDLALRASGRVGRARAIVTRDRATAGDVGLIIVPRSEAAKPVPTLELLNQVEDYVGARLTPTASLWVAGPEWLEVTVEAEVVPRPSRAATEVRSAAHQRLQAFLHPLTGGPDGDGWPFGRKPERADLLAVLAATPGVDHVRWMSFQETPASDGLPADRFLVFPGDHRITLAAGGGVPG